ncbi:MAG: hypothetical protein WKF93_07915, partial [Acidimicrobiales bacterium]
MTERSEGMPGARAPASRTADGARGRSPREGMPRLLTLFGAGRTAVGVALLVAPAAARSAFGPVADQPAGKAVLRALGVRDAALGVGLLLAVRAGAPVRTWLALGAASDALDAVVMATTPAADLGPAAKVVLAASVSGTVTG